MADPTLMKAIEAIFFVSDRPVSLDSLARVFPDAHKAEIEGAIVELTAQWRALDRGFALYEVAGGYQFRTMPELHEYILTFRETRPFRLSRAALEVLAIVAYKQPATRVDIDHIRGVDSSGVLGILLEKGLIEIKGRQEIPGRAFLYATTEKFLETFGLVGLVDLPTLSELEEIEEALASQASS